MTATIQTQSPRLSAERFTFPYSMTWAEFKVLARALAGRRSIRLSYLDGHVEIMTISNDHETFKCMLALLLGIFFTERDIDFTPTGSATLESEEKGVRKEPDLSYRFGENRRQKPVPDLAIEIVFSSGDAKKLEYYRRFEIPEIWFWQDGVFAFYQLQGDRYEPIPISQFLPDLDLDLLARCLQMSEEKEALKTFRQAIQAN